MLRVLIFLGAAAVLVWAGCMEFGPTCVVESSADLAAISESGIECQLLSVTETKLSTLGGGEGIRRAEGVYIGQNDVLVDISALRDISFGNLTLVGNRALETVAAGPLAGRLITVDRNAAKAIALKLTGPIVEIFISEEYLEEVRLDGTPVETQLSFSKTVPRNAQWDSTAIGLTSLKIFEAPNANASADLEILGVPSRLVGVYGSGLAPTAPEVDVYYARLRELGFDGTLDVCPHRCDANQTPTCDDPSRDEADWRVGCVVREGS